MTTTAPSPHRFVRADGPDKVTGSGRYTADLTLTGVLAAKFRYADVSHARITRLDVSAARSMPGVLAVLTQDDVPDVRFGPFVFDIDRLGALTRTALGSVMFELVHHVKA